LKLKQSPLGNDRPVVNEKRPAENCRREERGFDPTDEAFEASGLGRIARERNEEPNPASDGRMSPAPFLGRDAVELGHSLER